MNGRKPVLFSDALKAATALTQALGDALGPEVHLVRDLYGRVRVVLGGSREDYMADRQQALTQFRQRLAEGLGAHGFPPDQSVLFKGELLVADDDAVWRDRRLVPTDVGPRIYVLDRQLIGQDWLRSPLPRKTKNPRVVFFGIKGGVGRSTALIIWAWHLAKQGKRVLVLDLDLESPGASSTLLPAAHLPDFGIVDWLVEDGVGQGAVVEKEMVAWSPLAEGLGGELRVVPAYGRNSAEYLPKLARCYAESSGDGVAPWAARVQQMIERLEAAEKPDLVILDSRAGLHDIAAALVTRMDADALLFAVDSPQTWQAYSFLFEQWQGNPKILRDFRDRLRIVASMVPETGREEYLGQFRENAWDLFRDRLYDEAGPEDTEAFTFDLNDEEAPHSPLPIFWHRALQAFDPLPPGSSLMTGVDDRTAEEALGVFMQWADRLAGTAEEVP